MVFPAAEPDIRHRQRNRSRGEAHMRKDGFYWVEGKHGVGWKIAEWSFDNWYLSGIETPFEDTDFQNIDEKRLER
jgi:hypothetical protein